jgi:uncharacterized protein YndB with AHSA1/START domain
MSLARQCVSQDFISNDMLRTAAEPPSRRAVFGVTMTATAPQLTITRHIAAPRERVFDAWLDSEALAHWMRADAFEDSIVTVDPRVGGGFRVVMMPKDREPVEHWGEYLRIEPPSLLSFIWISKNTDRWPSEVTVEFHERGGGTDLVLTHRGLPERAVDGHRAGWTEILGVFERWMETAA